MRVTDLVTNGEAPATAEKPGDRRIHICGCGPSLHSWPVEQINDCDLVLAINRAVEMPGLRVDYWVFGDAWVMDFQGQPRRGLVTGLGDHYAERFGLGGLRVITWREAGRQLPLGYHPQFSLEAALGAAILLGAGGIELFGVDWVGTTDNLGAEQRRPRDRDAFRWGRERRGFEFIGGFFWQRFGIELGRNLPGLAPT